MSDVMEELVETVRSVGPRDESMDGVRYRVHPLRRDVRYKLFRYRQRGDVLVPGLVEYFERQFRPGWNWDNFSFVWDLSPVDPLRAIPEREWLNEGGAAVDPREGETFTAARFYPNGFTRQAR